MLGGGVDVGVEGCGVDVYGRGGVGDVEGDFVVVGDEEGFDGCDVCYVVGGWGVGWYWCGKDFGRSWEGGWWVYCLEMVGVVFEGVYD